MSHERGKYVRNKLIKYLDVTGTVNEVSELSQNTNTHHISNTHATAWQWHLCTGRTLQILLHGSDTCALTEHDKSATWQWHLCTDRTRQIWNYSSRHVLFEKLQNTHSLRDCRLSSRFNWILLFSWLLRGIRWFKTYVSGLPIGLIFKVQATTVWFLKMGPICSPETSLLHHLTPRNNPEDGRIHALWSEKK
jgi:hypothetical protein